MKQMNVARGATALLALWMGLTSCGMPQGSPQSQPVLSTEQRLEIVTEPVSYTEEELESTVTRSAAVSERLLRLFGGPVLEETQRQKLREEIEETMIPLFYTHSVYPSESQRLLTALEELCNGAEQENPSMRLLLLRLYQNTLPILGSDRTGRLAFAAVGIWLRTEIDHNHRRYEENPKYTWYLEDAQRFEEILGRIEETVGETAFVEIASISMFALSAITEHINGTSGTLETTREELLAILRLQAERFANAAITAEQWQCVADLLTVRVPSGSTSLLSRELIALINDGYARRAAALIPEALALYHGILQALSVEELFAIQEGPPPSTGTGALHRPAPP